MICNILEFNSTRKRMSVIVHNKEEKRTFLLCKGADSIIQELLEKTPENDVEDPTSPLSNLMHGVESWAETGLRTLVLAKREL